MTQTSPDTIPPLNAPQTAEAEAIFGPVRFTARASATPAGYLALGLAISGVLLGVAAVVWAARAKGRGAGR